MKTRRTLIRSPLEWQVQRRLYHILRFRCWPTRWHTAQDATPGHSRRHS